MLLVTFHFGLEKKFIHASFIFYLRPWATHLLSCLKLNKRMLMLFELGLTFPGTVSCRVRLWEHACNFWEHATRRWQEGNWSGVDRRKLVRDWKISAVVLAISNEPETSQKIKKNIYLIWDTLYIFVFLPNFVSFVLIDQDHVNSPNEAADSHYSCFLYLLVKASLFSFHLLSEMSRPVSSTMNVCRRRRGTSPEKLHPCDPQLFAAPTTLTNFLWEQYTSIHLYNPRQSFCTFRANFFFSVR